MSLEVVGPERLSVSRSVTVTAKGIQKLESSPVVGGKLEGCLGASISALLARVVGECGAGVSGVFELEVQEPGMQLERQPGAGAAEAQRHTAARRSS